MIGRRHLDRIRAIRTGRTALLMAPMLLLGLNAASAAPPVVTNLPPLPPAVIDNNLTIGGEDLNGRKVQTRMTVLVKIDGNGPYRFVVDSGADTTVLGSRIAEALKLPARSPVMLHGTTDSSLVPRVAVDELGLGQSVIHSLELPVLKETNLGGEGLIGIDALVEQRLMLDFEKRVIKIEDAKKPTQRLDGEIVVTARRQRGQLILTQASTNGKSVDAVIDTGSEISIGNLALRQLLLRRFPTKLTTVEATGVTGVTVKLQIAKIAEVRLGPVVLQDVPVAFADVPPFTVFGLANRPALLLGTDLMETFRRVSLDFRARKVRFQLRRCDSTELIINTSPSNATSRLSTAGGDRAVCAR